MLYFVLVTYYILVLLLSKLFRACFRPNRNGERCSRSKALQTLKLPIIQMGNEMQRNSKHVESKDK